MTNLPTSAATRLAIIPRAFLSYKQFVNWKPVPRGDKIDKVPCNPNGGEIDAHDPLKWLTAEQAAASAYGIAFVFSTRDPFFFVDLDHALITDPATGVKTWSPWAQWVFAQFPGAAYEVSHSGDGLHLFGTGGGVLEPEHRCKRRGLDVEIYTNLRFVALTGTQAAGDASLDFSAVLPGFMKACDLEGLQAGEIDTDLEVWPIHAEYTGPADDSVLISKMCDSSGSFGSMFGTKVHPRDLWAANVNALAKSWPAEGRADGLPYDASAADAALLWHLAYWTGQDVGRMKRLFRQSSLYREKKYTGKGEYRINRILRRVALRNPKVYNKPRATPLPVPIDATYTVVQPQAALPAPDEPAVDVDGYTPPKPPSSPSVTALTPVKPVSDDGVQLDLTEQQKLFAGCVYVGDRHAVMLCDGHLVKPPVFEALFSNWEFQMSNDYRKPTRNAFEAFTKNRMHRFPKVRSAVFRPDRPAGEIDLAASTVNLWYPPKINEREGDLTKFFIHLNKLIPNDRDRMILVTYMKALVRFPGVKFQWAPVIQGAEGNGKSLFIRVLAHAVGYRYSHLPKAEQLEEKFNSWIEGNIFIGVEEIYIQERRKVLEILKDAITNDRIEIRGMGAEKRMADNVTNWLFCTNYKDAVPVNRNQRRYSIFYTAQQSLDDIKRDGLTGEYFTDLYNWLKGGGYAAIAHWLRYSPIDEEFNPAGSCQRCPSTSSTFDAIRESQGKFEQAVLEAVEDNREGCRGGWLSSTVLTTIMQETGVRLHTTKLNQSLADIGYFKRERSSICIMREGNKKPTLYATSETVGGTHEYFQAQGYS
jgi:hypothetical protein